MTEVLLPVPVPVIVRRFGCPFCRYRRSARKAAREHIARCWRNPAVRACLTCANFTDEPGGEPCVPGQPCDCKQCEAGVRDVEDGRIVSGCPLWKLKEGSDA